MLSSNHCHCSWIRWAQSFFLQAPQNESPSLSGEPQEGQYPLPNPTFSFGPSGSIPAPMAPSVSDTAGAPGLEIMSPPATKRPMLTAIMARAAGPHMMMQNTIRKNSTNPRDISAIPSRLEVSELIVSPSPRYRSLYLQCPS